MRIFWALIGVLVVCAAGVVVANRGEDSPAPQQASSQDSGQADAAALSPRELDASPTYAGGIDAAAQQLASGTEETVLKIEDRGPKPFAREEEAPDLDDLLGVVDETPLVIEEDATTVAIDEDAGVVAEDDDVEALANEEGLEEPWGDDEEIAALDAAAGETGDAESGEPASGEQASGEVEIVEGAETEGEVVAAGDGGVEEIATAPVTSEPVASEPVATEPVATEPVAEAGDAAANDVIEPAAPAWTVVEQEDGSLLINDSFVVRGEGSVEKPYEIGLDLLVSVQDAYNPRKGQDEIPAWLDRFQNKQVKLTGNLLFPLWAEQTDELLLMKNQWDGCCVGVPPTPYDAVEVKLASAVDLSRLGADFGSVTGRFKVEPYIRSNWLLGLYVMDGARLDR